MVTGASPALSGFLPSLSGGREAHHTQPLLAGPTPPGGKGQGRASWRGGWAARLIRPGASWPPQLCWLLPALPGP